MSFEMSVPPYSQAAERAVLGILLVDAAVSLSKLAELVDQDFFMPESREIWLAIARVVENEGAAAVNPISVWEALRSENTSARVADGLEGLMAYMQAAPLPQQLEHYAKILREKRILRDAIAFSQEIAARAYAGADAGELVSQLWTGAGRLQTMSTMQGGPVMVGEVLGDLAAIIERRQATGRLGDIMTGIEGIDARLGGLRRQQFTVIAAGPNVGKSALGCNICVNVATLSNVPTLIFSAEMAKTDLVERMIAGQTQTPIDRIAMGQAWPEFHRAAGVLGKAPLWIEDGKMAIDEIVGTAHRWHAQYVMRGQTRSGDEDLPLALMMVDYMQILDVKGKIERRDREVAMISAALKSLTRALHIPVIGISAVNRKGQEGGPSVLSSLRESGAVEYDADLVLIIHRDTKEGDPESQNRSGPVDLICVKNRNGRRGRIPLWWDQDWTTFRDPSHEDE